MPVLVRATLPVPDDFELAPLAPPAATNGGTGGSEPAPEGPVTALALVAPDGTRVPCQLEPLTRGPDGRVEVVEVLAPVSVPPGALGTGLRAAAGRVTFALERGRFALPKALDLDGAVAELSAKGPCRLAARDVYGQRYVADLLRPVSLRQVTHGPYLRRLAVSAVLRPEVDPKAQGAGAKGPEPLPHLCGIHAHLAFVAGDPRVALDLRVHTGLTSGSQPDTPDEVPVGGIWFDALDLELPSGWTCEAQFPDAGFGAERTEARPEGGAALSVRPIVRALEGGALHFMPPSAQFTRRLVLRPGTARAGHPTWEALGFAGAEGRASWGALARYFPQRTALPSVDLLDGGRGSQGALRAALRERRAALAETVRTGRRDGRKVHVDALGWCHPWLYAYQGVTGGEDIALTEGHVTAMAGERAGLEWYALMHQLNVCRHPVAMWRADGSVAGVEAWRDERGHLELEFFTDAWKQPRELRLPVHRGSAPAAHLEEVRRRGKRPSYDQGEPFSPSGPQPSGDGAVAAWMPHGGQHLIRFTKNAKALAWLAADPLAIDDLRLEAERFRLMVHDAPTAQTYTMCLARFEALVARRPHTGAEILRDHAWGVDAIVAAYALSDDPWRYRFRPWLKRYTDVLLGATMPTGIVCRFRYEQLLGGRFDGAQAFECAFIVQMQRSLVEGVFRGVDEARALPLRETIQRAADYLYFGPVFQRVPTRWSNGVPHAGPAFQFAVAPLAPGGGESQELPYCYAERWGEGYLPPDGRTHDLVETTYAYEALTYAEQYARELGRLDAAKYLERTLALEAGAASHGARIQAFQREDGATDGAASGNRVAYLARVQALSAQKAGRR